MTREESISWAEICQIRERANIWFVENGSQITLGILIAKLEQADPNITSKVGFLFPHSYRGDYSELAFEPEENVTVAEMLDSARGALGAIYEGYKGGEYVMDKDTLCWISPHGTSNGVRLTQALLDFMLSIGEKKVNND